jgi:hypothetical protein
MFQVSWEVYFRAFIERVGERFQDPGVSNYQYMKLRLST